MVELFPFFAIRTISICAIQTISICAIRTISIIPYVHPVGLYSVNSV